MRTYFYRARVPIVAAMDGVEGREASDDPRDTGLDQAHSPERDGPAAANDAPLIAPAPAVRPRLWQHHAPRRRADAEMPQRLARPLPRWHMPIAAVARHWPLRRLTAGLAGALIVAWIGGTALHPVGAREQALIETAGVVGPAQGPGLALSLPWPLGSARIEDLAQVRHLPAPRGEAENLMLTRDSALIDVGYDVRWRVRDLRAFVLRLADPEQTLALAADAAMRGALARTDLTDAFGPARAGLGRDAAMRLQSALDRAGAGIAIDGIDVTRADPPARVADALRAITAARAAAANEATEAHGWARQLIAHAQGETAAFDRNEAQYRAAPDVTRRRLYYETMERVLGQSDKVIVDAPGAQVPVSPREAPPHAPQ